MKKVNIAYYFSFNSGKGKGNMHGIHASHPAPGRNRQNKNHLLIPSLILSQTGDCRMYKDRKKYILPLTSNTRFFKFLQSPFLLHISTSSYLHKYLRRYHTKKTILIEQWPHIYNASTQGAEAGKPLWVQGQPGQKHTIERKTSLITHKFVNYTNSKIY